MTKLVVLKLDGNLEKQGFGVTLEIAEEGEARTVAIAGSLPANPNLLDRLDEWEKKYRHAGAAYRLKHNNYFHNWLTWGQLPNLSLGSMRITPKTIKFDVSREELEQCQQSAEELKADLADWLGSKDFLPVNNKIRSKLNQDERIRVLICSENSQLEKLPWHLWDFFADYSQAEVALSLPTFEEPKQPSTPKAKIKILAILGHSEGINIDEDRKLLEKLPNAETIFLVEPQPEQISNKLLEQDWDILFFAGHSETQEDRGRIYINKTDGLTIEELKYGLAKAVERGLQLAIFNSCDGLGLARDLAELNIPQTIVMRQPVPDKIAQTFLKHFLKEFASNKPFYLAVREARQRLHDEFERDFPCASWLPVICQNPAVIPPTWNELLGMPRDPAISSTAPVIPRVPEAKKQDEEDKTVTWWRGWETVAVSSVVATSLVMGVRSLGILQPLELNAYDYLMRLRPDEGADPRLLLVLMTDGDIKEQPAEERGNLISEEILELALAKLEPHLPIAIGFHFYRESPVGEEYEDLAARMTGKKRDRVIALCKYGKERGISAPPEISPGSQGFSNVLRDADGVIRRQLLAVESPSPCQDEYSFSIQLARRYLSDRGIELTFSDGLLQLGDTIFNTLEPNSGGYQDIDARGHQVLLNYRATRQIAHTITFDQLLKGDFNPDLVRNRLVIIGRSTLRFGDRRWLTPYSKTRGSISEITGTEIQAQMVSQILSAVMDERPLIGSWSEQGEMLWVLCWSAVGGIMAWRFSERSRLIPRMALALMILSGSCFWLLLQGSWVPLVPSALALVATAGGTATYNRDL
ncbi:MAG: CHASE2 domain-containing protein [Oscillatoria sp. SIO1A7]|nr:CHASE2 domain-containing protein [Oscillatoria sp. SIO1A7]